MDLEDKKTENKKNEVEWYDNPSIITDILLGLIVLIIILSQSFAINNNISTNDIFRSILNHNSIYFLVLIYFVVLKTKIGKRYFNFLNLFLMILYSIITITSLLTVFQSFTLSSILTLVINLLLILYLVHTFFRGTRIWKDFKLSKSPFNEITNSGYFYSIMVISIVLLTINLISTTSFDGTFLSLLDCAYIILFSRYVYLYFAFLDSKKKDINNKGNFDEYREKIKDSMNDLDEKFDDVKEKIVYTTMEVKDRVTDFIEEKELDEKFDDVKVDMNKSKRIKKKNKINIKFDADKNKQKGDK